VLLVLGRRTGAHCEDCLFQTQMFLLRRLGLNKLHCILYILSDYLLFWFIYESESLCCLLTCRKKHIRHHTKNTRCLNLLHLIWKIYHISTYYLYCLVLESHSLEKGEGWGFANQFNPTSILRLSQDRTWISFGIYHVLFWFNDQKWYVVV
jgi:hypothetical protein